MQADLKWQDVHGTWSIFTYLSFKFYGYNSCVCFLGFCFFTIFSAPLQMLRRTYAIPRRGSQSMR